MVFQNFTEFFELGRTTALVGLPDSGKTTLVKLLLRCYDCYDGSITVDD